MATGNLSIGWHRGDITPTKKTQIMGQFSTRISKEIVSPISATALALEVTGDDGSDHAVMLSVDAAADRFRDDMLRALEGRCPGLDPQKITIACTHTHTAPSTVRGWYDEPDDDTDFMNGDEYRLWASAQMADTVERAWTSRAPGSIARGFSYAVIGRNRRAVYQDGSGVMYGGTACREFEALEATDDHAVNMLFTRDAAGALTGILVNLACPSQCEEVNNYISADFWHPVRQGLAAQHGDAVHLLPQVAPAGDLSPHLMMDQAVEADLRNRLGVTSSGIIARRILAALDEGLATAAPAESSLQLEHHLHTWRIPRMKVTKEEYELEKRIPSLTEEELAKQHYAFRRLWPFGPICDLVGRYEQQGENPEHVVHSHIIRIGDAVFATNPFELFVDFGLRIRCRSQAMQTFLVQLADDSGNGFYLPTRRALAGGHYSAMIKSNWVGPDGGDILVDLTVEAINAAFPGAKYPRTR